MTGALIKSFLDGLAGPRPAEVRARTAEALRVRACDRCGLRFGGGEGAFAQHLADDGRGTRCLPVHVFESVLTEAGGIWYARGTEPPGPAKGRS